MERSIRKQHSRSFQERRLSVVPRVASTPARDTERSAVPGRAAGRLLRGMIQFPYTFVVMNWAAVVGLYAFLRKRKNIWVRSADVEVWEGMAEPAATLPPVQSTESVRKAA